MRTKQDYIGAEIVDIEEVSKGVMSSEIKIHTTKGTFTIFIEEGGDIHY